jgi:hypothetical protein
MGSVCPNLAQVLLVRQVQLIRLAVQVAYLYGVPMYLLACWTTALREVVALAANIESSASAALGGVSATREGSYGPAFPVVKEPCEGPPAHQGGAALEASGTNNSITEAIVAAIKIVDKADKARRMGPPSRVSVRDAGQYTDISALCHPSRAQKSWHAPTTPERNPMTYELAVRPARRLPVAAL